MHMMRLKSYCAKDVTHLTGIDRFTADCGITQVETVICSKGIFVM